MLTIKNPKTVARRSWLAAKPLQLFVRRVPRPGAYPLRAAARHPRRLHRTGQASARSLGHGDRHLRAQRAVAHKDSLGNAGNIVPGEVQRMSAGRGIMHSGSTQTPGSARICCGVWIIPDRTGGSASYELKSAYDASEKRGKLRPHRVADGAGLGDHPAERPHVCRSVRRWMVEPPTLAAGRLAYVHVARAERSR